MSYSLITALPSGGRPSLDRDDRRSTPLPGTGGGVVSVVTVCRRDSTHRRNDRGDRSVLDFGQTPALRGASVSIREGEILAVMGPSGSGKSTLLHCLRDPCAKIGEIRLSGTRIDTCPESERSSLRRDTFGFVFQFGQLVPELTAEENVALPLFWAGSTQRRTRARA